MFSYNHYIKTCNAYKDNKYNFCFLDTNVKKEKKQIYMVHDVDFDLDNAIKLSALESKNKIVSTYFIRIGAKNYNIFNEASKNKVKEILKHGNKIGLHYERTFNNLPIEKDIKKCKDILSNFLNVSVSHFNIHEPARTKIDVSKIYVNENRCYNSIFFKNTKYISDSGGRWREGCFSNHINDYNNLLVLTHPVWWYENNPASCY